LFPLSAKAAEPTALWADAESLPDLVRALDRWLDSESPYPPRATPSRIRLVSPHRILALSSTGHRQGGGRRRGLYDPDSRTIYLARPWSMRDARDVSVLLHELTHHRQATARHWYCPGQQELPAYRLQAAWLAEQAETIAINWIAATLAAGCVPRDIHPD
jgi:hypothetical protein